MATDDLDNAPTRSELVAGEIIDRVGDKWTLLVISALADGPVRFTALKSAVQGINQRMLTQTLRGLERDGIVDRHVYPTAPPRVDYELTTAGRELIAVVAGICDWSARHLETIETARRDYDTASATAPAPITSALT